MTNQYIVQCVAATDAVAVDPCGTVNGVAMRPVVAPLYQYAIDYAGTGALFSWVLSFVLIVFVVGYSVGAIVKTIKS